MKKMKLALLGAAVILAVTASIGTWAYFVGDAKFTNTITTGGVEIVLNDDLSSQTIENVMPGVPVDNVVTVTNTEDVAWVRAHVDIECTSAEGETLPLEIGEDVPAVIIGYKTGDTDGWIDGDDGYYYYRDPMTRNEESSALFDTVELNPAMGNEYQGCTVTLHIHADAVQIKHNNTDGEGNEITQLTAENLSEINGWPASAQEGE